MSEGCGDLVFLPGNQGARSDEAHVAAEDIQALGKFIPSMGPEPVPEGEAGVAGCMRQGAEFEDPEEGSVEAYAVLGEEEGAGGLEGLQEPDDRGKNRQEYEEDEECGGEVCGALETGMWDGMEALWHVTILPERPAFGNGVLSPPGGPRSTAGVLRVRLGRVCGVANR